jgi:putative FmdB family regulatory protein
MPTYEYVCEKCGHQFELFQSIKADALTTCPQEKCPQKKWGRGRVKKQINAGAGLLFKGTGFYITDYRSEGYKAAAKKDAAGGEAKPAASGSGSSSEGSGKSSSTEKAASKPVKAEKPATKSKN